jgi:hypothetical protein
MKPEASGSPPSPTLRWLARAATALAGHPAALRVLCIVAEYMGDDGTCSISQNYVAKRLGISRQAANKHFGFLDSSKLLPSRSEGSGLPKQYSRPIDGCLEMIPTPNENPRLAARGSISLGIF